MEYLLVAQDEVHVEHYIREGSDWRLSEARDLSDTVHLPSVGGTLPLTIIYEDVTFSPSS